VASADVSSWPKVSRVRRPESLQAYLKSSHLTSLALSSFAIVTSTIAMLAAGIRPLGWVLLAPVLWVPVLVVYAAHGIAKYYLALETFVENSDPQTPWPERLARTLPSRPANNAENFDQEAFMITVPAYGALHLIIWTFFILRWLRSTLLPQFRHPRMTQDQA
jgi:hypothetical protein